MLSFRLNTIYKEAEMSLEKKEKMSKMLGVSVSESFHKEVFDFVNERNWNMGAFLRQAIQESMTKVVKNEKRKS